MASAFDDAAVNNPTGGLCLSQAGFYAFLSLTYSFNEVIEWNSIYSVAWVLMSKPLNVAAWKMIRFLLSCVWQLFLIFFVMNILSSSSRVRSIFSSCELAPVWNDDGSGSGPIRQKAITGCDYTVVLPQLFKILFTAATTAFATIIDLGNILIFAAKGGTAWLQRRAHPDTN